MEAAANYLGQVAELAYASVLNTKNTVGSNPTLPTNWSKYFRELDQLISKERGKKNLLIVKEAVIMRLERAELCKNNPLLVEFFNEPRMGTIGD